ncbi:MAG TPA: hypothetical protein VNE39_02615 [Planctomycetota bacterium]|nr:hypothetical protein [Planctomycetota bacterium]
MSTTDAAPAATTGQFRLVLGAGLITTTLALLGVYLVNAYAGENIMGWYANYVIPVGAILVGLVAASGYGLASWFAGVKVTRILLVTIVVLQVAAYFAAQYIEYANLPAEVREKASFWEYFDLVTRSFKFKGRDGQWGPEVGAWGYGLRALEIVGFVLGSLIVPIVLWKKPYCNACHTYFRTRSLGLLPAGPPMKKLKKKDAEGQAAYAKEKEQTWAAGAALLATLTGHATGGRAEEFRALLAEHAPKAKQKEYGKLTRRIVLTASHCPRCHVGFLKATALAGQGKQMRQTPLGQAALGPGFVRTAILERK